MFLFFNESDHFRRFSLVDYGCLRKRRIVEVFYVAKPIVFKKKWSFFYVGLG